MEEKKFVQLKKEEFKIREYVKNAIGKSKISFVSIEYTPVGEKIIVTTSKPGFVIGRKGEKITELTETLKKNFKLENPHIEIKEIERPEFDAQTVADELALLLERFGSLKFKVIAYKMLQKIMKAGALGVEIRLSGKLPSERAKSWRFAEGYLKKTGDTAKIVDRAEAVAQTLPGTIGIKVSILSPEKKIHDKIIIDEKIKQKLLENQKILTEELKDGNTKKKGN
ncbi:MAG: 30S ribosomal protein S3 [Candidatus Pacearchaeota archaeon]